MTLPSTVRHRVVIVGSGFGGLFAAKSLAHAPDTIEVILISRTNHHLFQPLLYQVATGILSEGQIAPATRDVLKKKNVSIELAEVTGFDLEARHVTAVQPGGRNVNLPYDSLIVAAGAGQSYFGHDEYSEWAPGMKTLADALDHRARIFGAFEMAELEDDPEIRRAWLTFTVVGGGPTGVEIAGQIAELSRRSLKHEFRRFDSGEARVLLFEGGPEILATFGGNLSRKASRELERIGVEIHLNSIVTRIDADGVDVKGPDGSVRHFSSKTFFSLAHLYHVPPPPCARLRSERCDLRWRVIGVSAARQGIGRPRGWPLREIVNGIFYVMRSGCPWRQLPRTFRPGARSIAGLRLARCLPVREINHALVITDRERVGREPVLRRDHRQPEHQDHEAGGPRVMMPRHVQTHALVTHACLMIEPHPQHSNRTRLPASSRRLFLSSALASNPHAPTAPASSQSPSPQRLLSPIRSPTPQLQPPLPPSPPRRSGLPESWHRHWRRCSQTPPALSATGLAALRWNRTAHSPDTRRSS